MLCCAALRCRTPTRRFEASHGIAAELDADQTPTTSGVKRKKTAGQGKGCWKQPWQISTLFLDTAALLTALQTGWHLDWIAMPGQTHLASAFNVSQKLIYTVLSTFPVLTSPYSCSSLCGTSSTPGYIARPQAVMQHIYCTVVFGLHVQANSVECWEHTYMQV